MYLIFSIKHVEDIISHCSSSFRKYVNIQALTGIDMVYGRRKYSKKTSKSNAKYTRTNRKIVKRSPTLTPAIKSYVKRTIARTEEVKTVVTTLSDLQTGNYALIKPYVSDPGCGIISLTEAMDNIGQGTGQGDRIGNKIRVVKNIFKGYMYALNTTDTGGVPTNVTMYIGRLKAGISTPTNSAIAQMFQAGDTTFAPSDDNRSGLWAINKNLWNVYYRKTFKIGGSTSNIANAVSNNDYKAMRHFQVDLSRWMPKIINYNDGNNISTNAGLYAWFTIANYNDQIITGAYIPQVQYVAVNEFLFTDS